MSVRCDVKRRRLRWLAPLDRRIADFSLPGGGGIGSSCCRETISGVWFRSSSRIARVDIRCLPTSYFVRGQVMSPQSNDVVDVGRDANVQIDLIAPHHPPLDLRTRVPGAHRKISYFLQNGGRP